MAQATLSGDEAGREALERMCAVYRQPVAAFITAKGYKPEEVEDLVQDFFLRWLKSQAWKRACRDTGRFRSFLLGAVQHLLAHHAEKQNSQKRGGGRSTLSLDELAEVDGFQPSYEQDTAASTFDRQWAMTLVSGTVARVAEEYALKGKAEEFTVLRCFLPGSLVDMTLQEAATALSTESDRLKVAIHRMRGKFREALRAAVAQTVSAPHEIEEEMRYLRSLLTKASDFGNVEPATRKE